ncbi:MAG: hypothetical protein IKX97_04900 [Erysipelotrichaceae bacterium]|nr:hypothetical protein [Erysipelotrichaceae bacterium]
MKPENIVLLGFVNKAADYLDRHLEDNPNIRLTASDNINLNLLKEELNKNLSASLGNMSATAEKLLKAGYDAFDSFIDTQNSVSLTDEIDKLFDVNFNVGKDAGAKHARPSDHYQLNDTMQGEEADAESLSGQKPIFEMTDEDRELLRLITENVNRVNQMPKVKSDPADDRRYSSDSSFNDIYSRLSDDGELGFNTVSNKRRPYRDYDSNGYVDARVLNNVISNKPVLQPDKNDIVDMVKDLQKSDTRYYSDILGTKEEPEPAPAVEVKEEKPEEETEEKPYYGFMSDFLDDLKKKMYEEDERLAREDEEFKGIYDKLHDIYPYLTREFMKNVYFMKDDIMQEYPLNVKIIILHRIQFKEVENLRQFVEIALNHNYAINADENKLIVDAFKQHVNVDGKIITSIFEVANQSALLDADYVGYRVLFEEESE